VTGLFSIYEVALAPYRARTDATAQVISTCVDKNYTWTAVLLRLISDELQAYCRGIYLLLKGTIPTKIDSWKFVYRGLYIGYFNWAEMHLKKFDENDDSRVVLPDAV